MKKEQTIRLIDRAREPLLKESHLDAYVDQETAITLQNIIHDIEFGYSAEMIKGKILNGSYR